MLRPPADDAASEAIQANPRLDIAGKVDKISR
jgi:hypothetical protein